MCLNYVLTTVSLMLDRSDCTLLPPIHAWRNIRYIFIHEGFFSSLTLVISGGWNPLQTSRNSSLLQSTNWLAPSLKYWFPALNDSMISILLLNMLNRCAFSASSLYTHPCRDIHCSCLSDIDIVARLWDAEAWKAQTTKTSTDSHRDLSITKAMMTEIN